MYVSYFQSLIVCLHFVARGDFCPGTSIAAKDPRSLLVSLLSIRMPVGCTWKADRYYGGVISLPLLDTL